jgi:hypothetical protein
MCGSTCSHTQTDRNNCGSCGNACPTGDICAMGACTDAPPTHYVDSVPTAAEAPFVDACATPGSMAMLQNTDDSSAIVPLPFPFRYWATDLPAGAPINVTSNGFISMDGVPSALYFGISIPSTSAPNSVIAAHWGDDHTSATGICLAVVGTAPDRQWVVQWDQSYYCCTPGPILTYEIVLSESSGVIDIVFETMMGARAELTGLEDPTGGMGIGGCGPSTYSCLPSSGTRVRYTPIP